jgi:hypothetical protein
MMRSTDHVSTARVARARRPPRRSPRRPGIADGIIQLSADSRCALARRADVKAGAPLWTVEAADAVDERNGPLAHSVLENAARFPQLPQPPSSGVSHTTVPTRAGHSLAAPLGGLECGVHLTA